MHHITRRLSPSLLLAIGALFVALAGTAYAADQILITSSDQVGDDVIVQRTIADDAIGSAQIQDRAVTQLREAHPHLRARVAVNGAGQPTLVAGDVNKFTGLQRIEKGVVRVTFDTQNTLGAGRSLSQCAFTATPEASFKSGDEELKKLRVYTLPLFGSSTSVDVITVEDLGGIEEQPVDAARFSLVAAC